MKMKCIYILIVLTIYGNIKSQPVLLKLQHNPILSQEWKQYKSNLSLDTLKLPFFDDFSKNNIYPDSKLWLDQNVYVNRTFGLNPPTIGVATFDIINMAGDVYSHASQNPFIADYLTSKPINLNYYTTNNPFTISTQLLYYYETAKNIYHSSDSLFYKSGNFLLNCNVSPTTYNTSMNIYFGQNKIDVSDSLYYYDSNLSQFVYIQRFFYHYYNVSDSIYLSFYYQPKGNGGNAPDNTDSLVLQFKIPGMNWKHIWSIKGNNDSTFKRVMIPIKDTTFLRKGFQFRFYNYGSLGSLSAPSFASNVDFWNLDYVYLHANRNINDTIFPDVAINQYVPSFIKEPFKSLPWKHYHDSLQIDTLRLKYYNFSDDVVNVQRIQTIKNITSQQIIRIDTLGNENIAPFSHFNFKRKTNNGYFPTNNQPESIFEIKTFLSAPALQSFDYMQWNDTLRSYQIFKNYYAIDDGSAEYGVGLAGTGSQNGQMSMMFKPIVPDTLRGVYMYFNKTLNNASQKYFYLTIWNCYNGKPFQIIYKKEGFRPEYNGINQFHFYKIDTTIYVQDTIFIGWTQTTTDLLNLGFDLNYDYSSKIWYNLTGVWKQLPYIGTLMIRPVFSKEPIISISKQEFSKPITVYPNPAIDFINIDTKYPINFVLYDLAGKVILTGNENIINVSSVNNGLYILKIQQNNNTSIHKIMIQRL